jgi:hypothetical protein
MAHALTSLSGLFIGLAMVVAGIVVGLSADELASGADRPELFAWSIRLGALAALVGGNLVWFSLVVQRFFQRGLVDEVCNASLAGVCLLSGVAATVLGVMGR